MLHMTQLFNCIENIFSSEKNVVATSFFFVQDAILAMFDFEVVRQEFQSIQSRLQITHFAPTDFKP